MSQRVRATSSEVEGIELTDEEREAAECVAASDNPLSSVASWLVYLDNQSDNGS